MNIDRLPLDVVDLVSLGLLVVFFLRGIFKGFVWQIAGLVAVVGGLIAANRLSLPLAPHLREIFPALSEESSLDVITAFFLIFAAALILVAVLARLLKGVIDQLKLSSFDRILGGVFGVAKAAVLIIVVISFLSLFKPGPLQERIAHAYTGRWSETVVNKSSPLFPGPVQAKVRETMDTLRRNLPGTRPGVDREAPQDGSDRDPEGSSRRSRREPERRDR